MSNVVVKIARGNNCVVFVNKNNILRSNFNTQSARKTYRVTEQKMTEAVFLEKVGPLWLGYIYLESFIFFVDFSFRLDC